MRKIDRRQLFVWLICASSLAACTKPKPEPEPPVEPVCTVDEIVQATDGDTTRVAIRYSPTGSGTDTTWVTVEFPPGIRTWRTTGYFTDWVGIRAAFDGGGWPFRRDSLELSHGRVQVVHRRTYSGSPEYRKTIQYATSGRGAGRLPIFSKTEFANGRVDSIRYRTNGENVLGEIRYSGAAVVDSIAYAYEYPAARSEGDIHTVSRYLVYGGPSAILNMHLLKRSVSKLHGTTDYTYEYDAYGNVTALQYRDAGTGKDVSVRYSLTCR